MNKKKINLFWTGGWDSTFQLCRLSLKNVIVHPIYIVMDRKYRTGEKFEVLSQNKILDILKKRDTTKATILPVLRIHREHIKIPSHIMDAYQYYFNQGDGLGRQYLILGSYAYRHKSCYIQIEDYENNDEQSRTIRLIKSGNYQINNDNVGFLLKKGTDPKLYALFGNMYFSTSSMTEGDIVKWVDENNFWDVMKHTWTCYMPIDGKPCGFCQPCRTKLKQHLDFLIPEEARKRGFVYNYLNAKYEYSDTRLDIIFALWIRSTMNRFYKLNVIEDFLVKKYETYFKSLLENPVEFRIMNDRGQRDGLV